MSFEALRAVIGAHPHAHTIDACLSRFVSPSTSSSSPSSSSSQPPFSIPKPDVKVYPDALYINYHPLGVSFCCVPAQGARLQIGEKGWAPEEVMIESIDVYNPRPRLETITEGRRRPRGPEWKRFVGLPMDVPARTGDGSEDVDQSTHLPLTATTTGKALVSALGEPSRKGGGIGWVDVWLEWEHVGGDGVGLHFSLEDPRGDEVVGAEEQRRGLGGVWDRAGGWVWGVCKMYATGKRADDSAGGS